MQWKNKKKNTFVAENARGSHFFCNLHPISEQMLIGEMLEWLKRHAWKACIPLKGIRGSNPRLSAGWEIIFYFFLLLSLICKFVGIVICLTVLSPLI